MEEAELKGTVHKGSRNGRATDYVASVAVAGHPATGQGEEQYLEQSHSQLDAPPP